MKRNVGEMWKTKEGSKNIWKVKFPNEIMSFSTKKLAEKWIEAFELRKWGE